MLFEFFFLLTSSPPCVPGALHSFCHQMATQDNCSWEKFRLEVCREMSLMPFSRRFCPKRLNIHTFIHSGGGGCHAGCRPAHQEPELELSFKYLCTYTVSNNGAINTLVNLFWGQDKFWDTTRPTPAGTGSGRLDLNPQLQFKDPETEPRRMSGDRTKMDGGETSGEQ